MEVRDIIVGNKFFQIRHSVQLNFFNQLGEFQKKFKDKYPFVVVGQNHKTILRDDIDDEKANKKIYLSLKDSGVIDTDCRDKEIFIQTSKELSEFASNNMSVGAFKSAGIRTQYLIPINEPENELLKLLKKTIGKNALKQLGQQVGDFKMEFLAIDNEEKYKITISIANRITEEDSFFPKYGLMVDIDHILEGELSLSDLMKHIDNSDQKTIKKARDFIGNLLVRKE